MGASPPSRVDVAIIGAGQAGLSLSRCLDALGVDHLVLEGGRIAESWRAQRWDSFRLVTPNWTVRLAGRRYEGDEPHGFMTGRELTALAEQEGLKLQVGHVERFNSALLSARDKLGTINHTLLTLDALRTRGLEIRGVHLWGGVKNRAAIERYGEVDIL